MLIFALVVMAYPPVAAHENEVVVQTENELLTAIENHVQTIVIDGYIPLSDEVIVTRNLTITGQGVLTVSDNHRHFAIEHGSHLVLDGDITLTRAANYIARGGGIVVRRGTFTLYDGQISDNYARWGGGVFLNLGNVNLNGGSVRNNYAMFGGGVYALGGHVTISGTNINSNHAERGGGIYIGTQLGEQNLPVLTMRGGVISDNFATFTGGGIFSSISNVFLERGVISGNIASGHGGVYICVSTFHQIGSRIQIHDNYPRNRHEPPEMSLFERVIELLFSITIIHIIVLFALAGTGVYLSKRKNVRGG